MPQSTEQMNEWATYLTSVAKRLDALAKPLLKDKPLRQLTEDACAALDTLLGYFVSGIGDPGDQQSPPAGESELQFEDSPPAVEGMSVYVYRNASYGDATNRGVSSRFGRFVLVSDHLPKDAVSGPDCPPLRLFTSINPDGTITALRAEPFDPPPPGYVSYKDGGNFVYSPHKAAFRKLTDGRPIPIWDRTDTYEMDRLLHLD